MIDSKIELLIALSGPIAVGKTTFFNQLNARFSFKIIKSSDLIREKGDFSDSGRGRRNLQKAGDDLDNKTDYKWVVGATQECIERYSDCKRWLFDSVRKEKQVMHFRKAYNNCFLHIHLTASEEVLEERYLKRQKEQPCNELYKAPYEEAINHPNERASRDLIGIADIVLDASQDDISNSPQFAETIELIKKYFKD